MSIRRERIDIIYDMLLSIQSSKGKIKSTHLMYKANLSHEKLKKYTAELIIKELIVKHSKGRNQWFEITDKGLKFVSEIKRIKEFSDSFGI
jgi:predicted transcriptional regulator